MEGDLNTDLTRDRSLHTKYLLSMCEEESLKCVSTHTKFHIDYTYERKLNYSKSNIDHLIVSCKLFDSMEQFTVYMMVIISQIMLLFLCEFILPYHTYHMIMLMLSVLTSLCGRKLTSNSCHNIKKMSWFHVRLYYC